MSSEAVGQSPFIKHVDLSLEGIPFEDDFFDGVSAYNFLEHVPRILHRADRTATVWPFVELMNEIWRVLKPGGCLYAITPAFPRNEVFVDPTHVNPISGKTHLYFTLPHCGAGMYGFRGCFKARRVKWTRDKGCEYEPLRPSPQQHVVRLWRFIRRRNAHLLWELEAVKPNPLKGDLT